MARYRYKPRAHDRYGYEQHVSLNFRASKKLRRIKFALLGIIGLALVVLMYSGYWFSLAFVLKSTVAEWVQAQRADGWNVTYDEPRLSGFPWHVKLQLDKVAIQGGVVHGGLEQLDLNVGLLSPLTIEAVAQGRLDFTTPDLTTTGTAERATISLDGASWNLDLKGLSLSDNAGIGQLRASYTVSEEVATFSIRGNAIAVPPSVDSPLGREISGLEVRGTMSNPPPSYSKLDVTRWRDQKSLIDVERLAVTYGVLSLSGSGTVALDEDLQPLSAFTVRAEGLFQTLGALQRRGLIAAKSVMLARVFLGAMAKRGSNGKSSVSLPINVQGGVLSLGPQAVYKVPHITW